MFDTILKWTEAEKELHRQAMIEHGKDWDAVSKGSPHPTNPMVVLMPVQVLVLLVAVGGGGRLV